MSTTDVDDTMDKLVAGVDAVAVVVNDPPIAVAEAIVSENTTRAELSQMTELLSNEIDAKLVNNYSSRSDTAPGRATSARSNSAIANSSDGPSADDKVSNSMLHFLSYESFTQYVCIIGG